MSLKMPPQGRDLCAKTQANHEYKHEFEKLGWLSCSRYTCLHCGHVKETKERG